MFLPFKSNEGGFFFLSWNRHEVGFGSQTTLSGKTKEARSCLQHLLPCPNLESHPPGLNLCPSGLTLTSSKSLGEGHAVPFPLFSQQDAGCGCLPCSPCTTTAKPGASGISAAWLVTTAGAQALGEGWSRSPAHVHLHLRHLQSSVPAGMAEGGRGRVDRSTLSTHSQGQRCVTLREALHQGHVTVSRCHQTCHPPQRHQTCPLPQPWGLFALCPPIAITATQPCQDCV